MMGHKMFHPNDIFWEECKVSLYNYYEIKQNFTVFLLLLQGPLYTSGSLEIVSETNETLKFIKDNWDELRTHYFTEWKTLRIC